MEPVPPCTCRRSSSLRAAVAAARPWESACASATASRVARNLAAAVVFGMALAHVATNPPRTGDRHSSRFLATPIRARDTRWPRRGPMPLDVGTLAQANGEAHADRRRGRAEVYERDRGTRIAFGNRNRQKESKPVPRCSRGTSPKSAGRRRASGSRCW